MHLDKLVNHLIDQAVKSDKEKVLYVSAFQFSRKAIDLLGPAWDRAEHHREREKHYTTELEKSEKKLREEGISIEVIDPQTGMGYVGALCSGGISMGNVGNSLNLTQAPKFQPKINQDLLAIVEKMKTKMLEHRKKGEKFEKLARAFKCSPETVVTLTVEDCHDFQLEN